MHFFKNRNRTNQEGFFKQKMKNHKKQLKKGWEVVTEATERAVSSDLQTWTSCCQEAGKEPSSRETGCRPNIEDDWP